MDPSKIAERLMDEHDNSARYQPFAAACGIANVADAYAVQHEFVRRQMAVRGVSRRGYKIGLTTKRMQDMCGIDSPIAGVILSDRVHGSGVTLALSTYGHAGLEFEIAVRLARDLHTAGGTPALAEVAAVVDSVAPAIEVIDDRGADYRTLEALSVIADNGWNGGVVLGEFIRPWPDLAAVEASVSIDGKTVAERGHGRDVLGHPFHSVAWLAAHLAETGSMLRAGEIVMTGSLVTTKFPDRDSTYRYQLSGLGAVALTMKV